MRKYGGMNFYNIIIYYIYNNIINLYCEELCKCGRCLMSQCHMSHVTSVTILRLSFPHGRGLIFHRRSPLAIEPFPGVSSGVSASQRGVYKV